MKEGKGAKFILVVRMLDQEIEDKTEEISFFAMGGEKFLLVEGKAQSVEVNLFESASSSGSRGSEAGCVHQDQVGRRRFALCHCLREI